jgi:regulator of sigma D
MTTQKNVESKKVKTMERRAGTREMVSRLLAERTEMLALYCRLAGLVPYNDDKQEKPAQKLLQEFCQVLVDYIAAGHFSLYERIINGTERRRDVAGLAEGLYPRIAESTESALNFNDKYDCGDHCEITESLEMDLSKLGEELAARIEYEDKLINTIDVTSPR